MEVKGKRVAVVGLGTSGKALARWLMQRGARVSVSESKPEAEFTGWLRENGRGLVGTEFGGNTEAFIRKSEIVAVSPGIPLSIGPLAASARAGIPVVGELELVLADCPARVVAITGTNGKTTTASLLGHVLRAGGVRSSVAGNIGIPASEAVGRATAGHVLVLEVSSFQLDTAPSFRPSVGILLNITPDHLDRYRSFEEYARAKEAVFSNQRDDDTAILNRADPRAGALAPSLKGRVRWFNAAGDEQDGMGTSGGWLTRTQDGKRERIMPASQVSLPGPHNLENALAACEAAAQLGVDSRSLADGLRSFPGVEHRLEPAGGIGQVQFVNDSKATNAEALAKALQSFTDPVVLIAGGRDKNLEFGNLKPLVAGRVKEAVLIGEAAEKLESAWQGAVSMRRAAGLEEAVGKAYEAARPKGIVLLSPGCASYDMFRDFEDRGRQFRTAVSRLMAKVAQEARSAG